MEKKEMKVFLESLEINNELKIRLTKEDVKKIREKLFVMENRKKSPKRICFKNLYDDLYYIERLS